MRISRTLSPGHPDRACDIIAESVVDEYLRRDPTSALRIRVTGGRGAIFACGVVSSKADFDVGAIITRTAASLGVRGHVEPFVSIEIVPGSFIMEATRTGRPISVVGYATNETPWALPAQVKLSRQIAKMLEDLRQHDPEWFWLEPAFEVVVCEPARGTFDAYVSCAHGEQEIAFARDKIKQAVKRMDPAINLHINEYGAIRSNGLDIDIGVSGISDEPYGSGILIPGSPVGLDASNPEKFGTWQARGLARRALERSGAQAVLVHATYLPGLVAPSALRVRDERGKDLLEPGDETTMTYASLVPFLRPGLSTNAAHWGFAGEVELPWEGGE